jgi:hypothetical protein
MSLMVTIEISEAGLRDGERRAVPADEPVISLESDESDPDKGPQIYEREYQFAGRVAKDGTPIYTRGPRRLRDG